MMIRSLLLLSIYLLQTHKQKQDETYNLVSEDTKKKKKHEEEKHEETKNYMSQEQDDHENHHHHSLRSTDERTRTHEKDHEHDEHDHEEKASDEKASEQERARGKMAAPPRFNLRQRVGVVGDLAHHRRGLLAARRLGSAAGLVRGTELLEEAVVCARLAVESDPRSVHVYLCRITRILGSSY